MKKLLFALLALFSLAVVSEVSATYNYRRHCGSCHKPKACEKKCVKKTTGPCKVEVIRHEGKKPNCQKTVCRQVQAPCTGIKTIEETTTWACPPGYQDVGGEAGEMMEVEYEGGRAVADAFEF